MFHYECTIGAEKGFKASEGTYVSQSIYPYV